MNSKNEEKLIIQIIKYMPALFIITLAVIGISYITINYHKELKKEQSTIKREYIDIHKNRIKINIETINRYIQDTLKDSEKQLQEELHHKINAVYNIAMNIYERNKDTLSKEEILKHIKEAIETLRYANGTGYFSIHYMNGINILQPISKDFEGKSVLNRKDAKGNYPVQEAIKIAKIKGEGALTWYYFKPNNKTKHYKKIGIIKRFEPYNLILTTAMFEDDLQNEIKKDILKHLKMMEYEDQGYLFILDTKGNVILTKDDIPVIQYEKSILMKKFKIFVNSKKINEFVNYSFDNSRREYSKISYLQKIDTMDWVIGTGFDLDKVNASIQKKSQESQEKFYKKSIFLLISTIIISLILFILSLYFSKFLGKKFYLYKKQLLKQENEKANNYKQTIISLVDLIEQRDFYTAGHSYRVAEYAVTIAKAMNFSSEDVSMLRQIGLLHDIGKTAIPDSILLKPGKLTKQEFDIIKSHATLGYEIISKIPMFKEFSKIILYHHERFDGSGYPKGLKGNQIPILASILAIADAFDAMTSSRIYNQTKTAQEALDELKRNSGILFDPNVIEIALKTLKKIDIQVDKYQTQLPNTPIEKERFAYFFKDPLTKLSNENYLELLFKQNLHQYRCLNLIIIHNFSSYNENFGWEKGDELLIYISNLIKDHSIAKEIFRFQGTNFILLNDLHIDINLSIINKKLEEYKINCELRHFDINRYSSIEILKEALAKH